MSAAGLPELDDVLERLQIGASLSSAELLAVRTTLVIGRKFRSNLSQLEPEHFPKLTAYSAGLSSAYKRGIRNMLDSARPHSLFVHCGGAAPIDFVYLYSLPAPSTEYGVWLCDARLDGRDENRCGDGSKALNVRFAVVQSSEQQRD